MKSRHHYLTLSFVALCIVLGSVGLVNADLIIQYQSPAGSYIGVTNQNQPLAKVVVGANNVPIGSFGVFGQAVAAGNVKWVIFDKLTPSAPVYLSAAQTVSADPGTFTAEAEWYDSPEMSFTLLAGHTYAMGIIADQVGANSFRWGSAPDSPFGGTPTVVANGLSLPFMQSLDNSGLVSGAFTNTPTLYTVDNSNRRQTSLRICSPEDIPEPSTLVLLGFGAVALLGFWRGKK